MIVRLLALIGVTTMFVVTLLLSVLLLLTRIMFLFGTRPVATWVEFKALVRRRCGRANSPEARRNSFRVYSDKDGG